MEIWKDVKDFISLYKVSNMGRVKSLKRVYEQKIRNKFNPNGITGIREYTNKSGNKYFTASYQKEGKKQTKYFSIEKLGYEEARQQAINEVLKYPKYKIVNVEEKILKATKNQYGYLQIQLCTIGHKHINKLIHKLVATAFIDNPENKSDINHKNGNKLDNRVYNLEWNTQKENNQHAINTGLNKTKKILCVDLNREFETAYKAAEWINEIKFDNRKLIKSLRHNIRQCATNKQSIAYGFKWKYID